MTLREFFTTWLSGSKLVHKSFCVISGFALCISIRVLNLSFISKSTKPQCTTIRSILKLALFFMNSVKIMNKRSSHCCALALNLHISCIIFGTAIGFSIIFIFNKEDTFFKIRLLNVRVRGCSC
ncbi:unnamed protein product [Moneuplotes crassus]|uniref:Uncharacterized protein n=1 Tax=Euplotes crassus TaxID=5936 RepID=A0AAD1UED9_EUPCR|nr:unnamed protein product [Moneuplotes crassus]